MTKILNPLVRRAAGRRHVGWAAQIRHTGRRSGRAYSTPAGARRVDDTFVVPLTFGTRSDWVRNVTTAGGCTIRWKARDYATSQPDIVSIGEAMATAHDAFKMPERAFMRALGIRNFLQLRITAT
jgi:deazaflavin-dependent oxidoreductase (nitroreductase family)